METRTRPSKLIKGQILRTRLPVEPFAVQRYTLLTLAWKNHVIGSELECRARIRAQGYLIEYHVYSYTSTLPWWEIVARFPSRSIGRHFYKWATFPRWTFGKVTNADNKHLQTYNTTFLFFFNQKPIFNFQFPKITRSVSGNRYDPVKTFNCNAVLVMRFLNQTFPSYQ